MQIFKTNLFKTNNIEINLNNRTKKSSEVFVTEPISKYEIPNHYYPAFKSNVEIYEKMKQVSSKKANVEELKNKGYNIDKKQVKIKTLQFVKF